MVVLLPRAGPTSLLFQQKPLSSLCVASLLLLHLNWHQSGLIGVKCGEIPGCMALPELLSGRQITCRRERIRELEGIACKWEEQPKSPSSPRSAEAEDCSWQCTCFGDGWSCGCAMGKPHSLSPSKPSIIFCSKALVPPTCGRGVQVTSNWMDSNQQAAKPLTSNRSCSSCNGS